MGLMIGGAGLLAAALAVIVLARGDGPQTGVTFLGEPVPQATLDLGREVYAANCASCHGAALEGQPDWRRRLDNGRMPAPPHDDSGHTWHHADRMLFQITKRGVSAVVPDYDSDMPAFEG
ncbi:MAG TPA: cytochrome c, partial [Paracoccaceae bacterium]